MNPYLGWQAHRSDLLWPRKAPWQAMIVACGSFSKLWPNLLNISIFWSRVCFTVERDESGHHLLYPYVTSFSTLLWVFSHQISIIYPSSLQVERRNLGLGGGEVVFGEVHPFIFWMENQPKEMKKVRAIVLGGSGATGSVPYPGFIVASDSSATGVSRKSWSSIWVWISHDSLSMPFSPIHPFLSSIFFS